VHTDIQNIGAIPSSGFNVILAEVKDNIEKQISLKRIDALKTQESYELQYQVQDGSYPKVF